MDAWMGYNDSTEDYRGPESCKKKEIEGEGSSANFSKINIGVDNEP